MMSHFLALRRHQTIDLIYGRALQWKEITKIQNNERVNLSTDGSIRPYSYTRHCRTQYCDKKIFLGHRSLKAKVSSLKNQGMFFQSLPWLSLKHVAQNYLFIAIYFYCNIFLLHYLFIAISFYHTIFLSQYLFIAISFYRNTFLSQYLFIAISFYHNIFLSQYLFYRNIFLSQYLFIAMSFYCNIFLLQYLFIAISFYRNIFLLQYCVPKCLVWTVGSIKETNFFVKLWLTVNLIAVAFKTWFK